jgi:hypothetical protein
MTERKARKRIASITILPLFPMELGGAPLDPKNLWLQPWVGECNAKQKDRLEFELSPLVCNGSLSLADAQHEIATDWRASYSDRIDPNGCETDE